jgi:hypothetical protein
MNTQSAGPGNHERDGLDVIPTFHWCQVKTANPHFCAHNRQLQSVQDVFATIASDVAVPLRAPFEILGRGSRLRQYYIRKLLLLVCGKDDRVEQLVSHFEIVDPLGTCKLRDTAGIVHLHNLRRIADTRTDRRE